MSEDHHDSSAALGEEHQAHDKTSALPKHSPPARPTITPPTHTLTYETHTQSLLVQSYCRHWVKLNAGCEAHNHTHTHGRTNAACVYSLVKSTVLCCAKLSVRSLFSEDITMAVPPKTKTQLTAPTV